MQTLSNVDQVALELRDKIFQTTDMFDRVYMNAQVDDATRLLFCEVLRRDLTPVVQANRDVITTFDIQLEDSEELFSVYATVVFKVRSHSTPVLPLVARSSCPVRPLLNMFDTVGSSL